MKNLLSTLLLAFITVALPAQTDDNVNLSAYGAGKVSFGPSYGAPGVLGVPVRFKPKEDLALQIGPYLGAVPVYTYNDELRVERGFTIGGAITIFGNRYYKSRKEKIKHHGFTLKAGHQFGDFSTSYIAGGWAVETFKKRNQNRSFIFELGLGGYIPHWENTFGEYQEPKFTPTLMFNLQWAFYLKKGRAKEINGSSAGTDSQGRPKKEGRYAGIAMGFGWSKQKINYGFVFPQPYQSARVHTFGLQYGAPLSAKMDWQIELAFTQHGYQVEKALTIQGVKINAKADARIRYLEAPFLLAYRIPLGKSGFELSSMPGVSLGYAVSGKTLTRGKGENENRKVEARIADKKSFEGVESGDRLDAALLLGLRCAYPIKKVGSIFIETRYHFGILNLDRNKDFDYTEEGDKAFNRSLLLRAGVMYGL